MWQRRKSVDTQKRCREVVHNVAMDVQVTKTHFTQSLTNIFVYIYIIYICNYLKKTLKKPGGFTDSDVTLPLIRCEPVHGHSD